AGARWPRGTTRRPRQRECGAAGAPGGIGTRLGVAVLPALAQRLLEVGPERLAILEPRAEAEQPRRDAVALPAAAALDQARDAAERARIDDHARRRLDLPRRLRIGHVEGEEPAEAGVADNLDRRMGAQPLGEEAGGLGLPPHAEFERLQPAQHEPGGIRCGDDAGAAAETPQLLGSGGVAADHCAEQRVVVAREVLRRAVQDEVGAVLQGSQMHRRGHGRIDDDRGRVGGRRREIRHREVRGAGRLQPAELYFVGRRPRLVELPDSKAPSSFEALMNTHSTELTRPCSSGGVTSRTAVERMFMLIMSAKPLIASAASERGSDRERPKTIIIAPKTATTVSRAGPARKGSGRRARSRPAERAPTDGAARNMPRPIGPTSRIVRANTGASALQ